MELEENREKIPKLRREFVKEKPEFERRIKLEQMKLEESIGKRGKERGSPLCNFVEIAIYGPQGRGTLRQQLTILHVLHILNILHYIALPWTILDYHALS